MKRIALWVSLGTATLGVAALSQQKQSVETKESTFKAVTIDGCHRNSQEAEVFSFYGNPGEVGTKLDNFELHLTTHRVFMFIIESSTSAHVSLFEGVEETKDEDKRYNEFRLFTWDGTSARGMREKVSDEILAIKGRLCVGEQVKSLVQEFGATGSEKIAAPRTGRAVFNHLADPFKDQYIRLTIFIGC